MSEERRLEIIEIFKNYDFESFRCKHYPYPIINGLPMICFCSSKYLSDLWDELFDLSRKKEDSSYDLYVILWMEELTGWMYQKGKDGKMRLVRGTRDDEYNVRD